MFNDVKLSNGNPCIATTGKHGIRGEKAVVLMNGGWFQNAVFIADVIDESSFSLRDVDTSDESQFNPSDSLSRFSSPEKFQALEKYAFSISIEEAKSQKNNEPIKIGNCVYAVEMDFHKSKINGSRDTLMRLSKRKSISIILLQGKYIGGNVLSCQSILAAVKTSCNGDLLQESGKIASMRCRFYGLSNQTHYDSIE